MRLNKRIRFYKDYLALRKQANATAAVFPFAKFYPCLDDKDADSGTASGHYFHQDLYVARRIFESNPVRHVDIGSRVDGFVAHVAAFREIEVFDVRPLKNKIKNILFKKFDFTDASCTMKDYCDSVSSLHAVEHFGLGRYGDPLDYNGHLKGLDNIYTILQPLGKFYFAVPIGKQRIEFNAHRVFSVDYLIKLFEGKYHIDRFSYVDDAGDFFEQVSLNPADSHSNYHCNYGCGIFELTKMAVEQR